MLLVIGLRIISLVELVVSFSISSMPSPFCPSQYHGKNFRKTGISKSISLFIRFAYISCKQI